MASKSQIPCFHILAALVLFTVYVIVSQLTGSGALFWMKVIGLSLLSIAVVFMFYPFYLLRKHGSCEKGSNYLHTQRVVDKSLYTVVRHPQYLGYMFLVLGFMFIDQNWICTVIGVAIVLFLYLQAKAEEEYCVRRFGEEYLHYMKRVPRFNVVLGIIRQIVRS